MVQYIVGWAWILCCWVFKKKGYAYESLQKKLEKKLIILSFHFCHWFFQFKYWIPKLLKLFIS
jgi:hypothetical protein